MIVFLTIPQQHVITPEILQEGAIQAEWSLTTGASNTAPPGVTQQQRRHHLVHCSAATIATENMTQDAHLKIVRSAGSRKDRKKHAIGCESIHLDVDNGQLTV